MMAEPKYFRLTWTLDAAVQDDSEDVDQEPELKGIYAGVTTTPYVEGYPIIRAHTLDPSQSIVLCPTEARFDAGELMLRAGQTPVGIRLWAKCSALEIGDKPLIYTLQPHDATFNGKPQTLPTITFVAPEIPDEHDDVVDGEVVWDLTEVEWIQTAVKSGTTYTIRQVPDGVRMNEDGQAVFTYQGVDIADPVDLPSAAWPSIIGKPALIAAGATAFAARDQIGTQVCANIAALKGIASFAAALGASDGYVQVLGYYTPGDGGEGIFRWDSSDTTSPDNGGTIIAPSSGSLAVQGRWKRIYTPGVVNAHWFGLRGDWSGGDAVSGSGTNETVALTALIASVPDGSIIRFNSEKNYRIDPMVITKSVVLDFSEATVTTRTCHATNPAVAETLFYFQSPTGTARTMNTSARGDTSVTVTTSSQSTDFAAGDYVVLEDRYQTEDWDNPGSFTNTLGRAEMNRVASVNTGTGVVTLAAPTVHDYLTSPITITKVTPLVRPEVRNVGLLIDTDPGHSMTALVETPHAPHIMFFDACLEPRVVNVTVESWVGQIAVFNRCQRYYADRLTGRDPFYTDPGLGYVMRARHSVDGLAERVVGIHNRHTIDYHGSVRCTQRKNHTYDHTNVAYMTHGLDSRDIVSEDDSVVSDQIGWAHGNPQFNADYGFTIIRPFYDGTNIAIVADSLSEGTTIISPTLRTSVRAISIRGGAKNTEIDLTGGEIEIRGSDSAAWAVKAEVNPAATTQPRNVRIKGGGRLTGARALFSMNLSGAVTLDAVDPALVTMEAGTIAIAGTNSLAAPLQSSYLYPGISTMAPATWQMGNGQIYGSRIVCGRSVTLTKIGIEITTVGAIGGGSGCNMRLGIYALHPGTGVLTLLVDAGVIDATVLGYAEKTISLPVVAGQHLILVGVCQGGPTTTPIVRTNQGIDPYFSDTSGVNSTGLFNCGLQSTTTTFTSALPGTFSWIRPANSSARIPRIVVGC
jgi:hypothetical protein